MKKLFTTIAAFIIALGAMAETTETQDVNDGKDLNYWAKAVASRVKVSGYAQAGYTATLPVSDGKAVRVVDKRTVYK